MNKKLLVELLENPVARSITDGLPIKSHDDGDQLAFIIPVDIALTVIRKMIMHSYDNNKKDTQCRVDIIIEYSYITKRFKLSLNSKGSNFNIDNVDEISDWYESLKRIFNLLLNKSIYSNLQIWSEKQIIETEKQDQ
jgi:hypothetical protein